MIHAKEATKLSKEHGMLRLVLEDIEREIHFRASMGEFDANFEFTTGTVCLHALRRELELHGYQILELGVKGIDAEVTEGTITWRHHDR